MMRMAMSPAAAALLRDLLRRGGVGRDRILLTEFHSTDWQSLTFIGEQHRIRLRILSPRAEETVRQLVNGLEESEFRIPGHVVADIALSEEPTVKDDGSVELTIEALTIEE